jgi:AcrR family transcriptional regulator
MDAVNERPGLRVRKMLKTRLQIQEAALRLFQERSFDNVSVEHIANEAEVSPRTFFRYFESKEGVLFTTSDDDFAALQAMVRSHLPGQCPLVAVKEALLQFASYLEEQREFILARHRLVVQNPTLRPYYLNLQRSWEYAISECLAASTQGNMCWQECEIIAGITRTALTAGVKSWRRDGARRSLPEYVGAEFVRLDMIIGKGERAAAKGDG